MIASLIEKKQQWTWFVHRNKRQSSFKNELFKIVQTTLIGIVIDFVFLMDKQRN